ncbi:right-handed parallel beta-helix repeat-containing protein [Natronococcus wangiae]|uniref:right-handed parallel beta-helix repeat-containing protein n=1 Tax=Natronococcus wangiae TaxID=3068275 RepID=UPI00273DBBC6|nr:right-handed parallel beta-helix repeat-containing protein [Natronococcus sp. AD5]
MTENGSPIGSNESDVSRRSYMQLLGAVGLGAGTHAASGGSDVAAAAPDGDGTANGITVSDSGIDVGDGITRLDFEGSLSPAVQDDSNSVQIQSASNRNVVNVRVDLGVRPRQDDLWAAIQRHYNSFSPANRNHLYVVPAETWFVRSNNLDLPDHQFFGLVGEPSATLRVNDRNVDRLMTVGRINTSAGRARQTVMRDLNIDISGDYDAGIGRWYTYGYGRIENIVMRGKRDRLHPDYGGDLHTLLVNGVQPETSNLIRQCLFPDGHVIYDPDVAERGYAIGFSSEPPNQGTNIWDGCQITGYGSGFYVSTSGGRNVIRGSHVRNCGRASIRIGDNDHLQDCTVTMTEHPGRPWTALWLESGDRQVVDNVLIRNEIEKDTEIVRLTQDGRARLSDVNIVDNGGSGRAMRIDDNDQTQTVFEGLTLVDRSSPTGWSDYAVYVRSSNVTFRDCDFDLESQSDTSRHGIYVTGGNVDRLSLDNCDVDPDGASLRFGGSGEEHNVTNSFFEGSVTSDSGTTLSNVLWVGNRHAGQTNFRGQRSNWQGDFNFGFNV